MTTAVMLGGEDESLKEIPTIILERDYLSSWFNAQIISEADLTKLLNGEEVLTDLGKLKLNK